MKDDFDLIRYDFPISKEGIDIIPISDIHLGASECMEKEWNAFCDEVMQNDNTYVILNGDLINNAVKNSKSNVYEEKYTPRMQKEMMIQCLSKISSRILAITEGNHEIRSAKEVDNYINYDIAYALGIPERYRPNAAFIVVRFSDEKGHHKSGERRPTYTLCATHGAGTTNKRFQDLGYAISNLDVMIVGHTHKPVVMKDKRIFIDTHNNKVSFKSFNTVVAGSWLEYGGYAMRAMYKPGANTLQAIHLSGDRKKVSITMY